MKEHEMETKTIELIATAASVRLKKLSTFALLAFIVLSEPLRVIAQEAPQPRSMPPRDWYWHGPWQGPWHGSQFWWFCPLMLLFMFLIFCAVFFFGRRHHWGAPWHMMHRGGALQPILHCRY
jgi:hypothetical protein